MTGLVVNVSKLKLNYYTAIAPAPGQYQWFWRVGYDVGTKAERWTAIRERNFIVTAPEGARAVVVATGAKEDGTQVDTPNDQTTENPAPPEGEVIWQADLTDTTGWKWDGEASAEHLEGGVLRVNNTTRSVYWADEMLEGPVLIDMEVRTNDELCRAILFFMADGVNGEDIFSWERPAADYGDYAYENTMRLYTAGMMREGCGTENNFRFLGGELPEHLQILRVPAPDLTEEQKPLYKQAFADFQPYSIPSTGMDGYVLGQWQRYQVLVDGPLIRVWVDGRLLHEVTDDTPMTRGRVGFRNFRADTAVEVRNLRAIRPAE